MEEQGEPLTFLLRACSLRRLELSRARPGPTTPSEAHIANSSCWRLSKSGFSARRAAWGPKDLYIVLKQSKRKEG